MNTFIIYMHKNKINGKIYIGQTCKSPEERWGTNGAKYKCQPKFYIDIEKYGWDNFEHIILEKNLTQKEANEKEKYYISKYNSRNENYGYNILPGGSNLSGENNPMFGKHHSDETKQKISFAAAHRSEETKQKMSESAKLRVIRDGAPFQGKHLSEEAKEKLRKVDKSYMQTQEYRQTMSKAVSGGKNGAAKKVKAINAVTKEEIIFDYKLAALQFLGLSRSSQKFLNKAIQNKTIYHNYYWEEI